MYKFFSWKNPCLIASQGKANVYIFHRAKYVIRFTVSSGGKVTFKK